MSAEVHVLGVVQRVFGPSADTVVFAVYDRSAREKRWLVATPQSLGWTQVRPQGDPADGFVRRLRNLLVGARVFAERSPDGRRRLRFVRGEDISALTFEDGAPVLRSASDGAPRAGRRRLRSVEPAQPWDALELAAYIPAAKPDPRKAIDKRLRAAIRRLKRTQTKIEVEVGRASESDDLRHRADLLLANLHRCTPDMTSLSVEDWETGDSRTLTFPKGGAADAAKKLYHRAGRFERGAVHGAKRLSLLREQISELQALLDAVELPASDVLRRAELLSPRTSRKQGDVAERLPYRIFLAGGGPIFVGRGATDNDTLTQRVARPHDLWLHARGRRGAHVVVPLERGAVCDPTRLADAAMLAAHFSEAATDGLVEVTYTPKRHVRKRRGMPPGAVQVEREKTIAVRMNKSRIRTLLASEN